MNDPNGYPEVAAVSADVIRRVMAEGATTHEPGLWKKEGEAHHKQHAAEHVLELMERGADEDLEHALCRLAMAVWCRNQGIA